MRLFHIEASKCHDITEIIPGIFAVAQMGEEYFPYLTVNYLPKRYNDVDKTGVILLTKKHGAVRMNYNFKDVKKDTEDLRNFVWYYLSQEHPIKNIGIQNQNDFRKFNPNTVIQGWQVKKWQLANNRCCKILIDGLTSFVIKFNVLHEIYKLSGKDVQNRGMCKVNRFKECLDNYPSQSHLFKICAEEVRWLCDNGYPLNIRVKKMDELVNKVRGNLYDYLNKNDLLVNKKKFDEIIDAGLFTDLGNRMGNKVANDPNVRSCLNDIFTEKDYYLRLVEGFTEKKNNDTFNWLWIVIFIIIVLLPTYWIYNKN